MDYIIVSLQHVTIYGQGTKMGFMGTGNVCG